VFADLCAEAISLLLSHPAHNKSAVFIGNSQFHFVSDFGALQLQKLSISNFWYNRGVYVA